MNSLMYISVDTTYLRDGQNARLSMTFVCKCHDLSRGNSTTRLVEIPHIVECHELSHGNATCHELSCGKATSYYGKKKISTVKFGT